jgi:hypothetical protein
LTFTFDVDDRFRVGRRTPFRFTVDNVATAGCCAAGADRQADYWYTVEQMRQVIPR